MQKQSVLSRQELLTYLEEEFPQVFGENGQIDIVELGFGDVTTRLNVRREHLRPGGTVSGPSMMLLADCGAYLSILSTIGKVPLAVTTNLNINFLRRPPQADLLCAISPLKIGKSLFVAEATMFSADDEEKKPVAHATMTYSIPPWERQPD